METSAGVARKTTSMPSAATASGAQTTFGGAPAPRGEGRGEASDRCSINTESTWGWC